MGRIKQYENTVLCILLDHEETRDDDRRLYYWFLREEHYNTDVSLEDFLLYGAINNYPNYDSISRVRRKIQERYPELRPAKNEQIRREEAEKDFRAYARNEE